jgi:hypothetical protein
MARYIYEGPVLQFDKVVAHRWTAETTAVSEAKARSNMIFQYKKSAGLAPTAKVTLPGKIRTEE